MKTRASLSLIPLLAAFGMADSFGAVPRNANPSFKPTPPKPDPVQDPREVERIKKANRLKREAKAQRKLELNERAAKMNPAWKK